MAIIHLTTLTMPAEVKARATACTPPSAALSGGGYVSLRSVPFPFLVLLMSGGHCLLALAQDVDRFLLIGRGIDEAPGNAFDKVCMI